MQYLLSCTCGKTFPVTRAQAGMTLHCPECGAEVVVPTIRNLTKLPTAQPEAATKSATRYATTERKWNPVLGVVAAICFLILCVSWALAAATAYERWGNRIAIRELDNWNVDKELVYGDEQIDKFTLSEMWDSWDSYRRQGMVTKSPPETFMVKEQFDHQRAIMYRLTGIGGVALLGLLATVLLGGRKRPANNAA